MAQSVIALALVAGAAAYLARGLLSRLRRRKTADSCPCSTGRSGKICRD